MTAKQKEIKLLARTRPMEELYELLKKELPPERLAEFETVERAGRAEKPHIQRLLKEVQRRMGVTDRILVTPAIIEALMGMDEYMGIGQMAQTELMFAPGITKILDDDMLRGVIAHEVGHHINGDPKRRAEMVDAIEDQEEVERQQKAMNPITRQQEYAADEMAARHGFGEGLRRALRLIGDRNLLAVLFDKGDDSHPPLIDRIRRLRQYEAEQRQAA